MPAIQLLNSCAKVRLGPIRRDRAAMWVIFDRSAFHGEHFRALTDELVQGATDSTMDELRRKP